MAPFSNRLKHAWNAFTNQNDNQKMVRSRYYGTSTSTRPDRNRLGVSNERSIIAAIYTRLGLDVASVDIRHVRVDDKRRYVDDIQSGLNTCLTLEANLDQSARAFKQDIATTLFDEGSLAIVPVDTTVSPETSGGSDIRTMRVGKIVDWMPQHVRVSLYNENVGERQDLVLHKRTVAIVENPLYSVMNEPNSTYQRLVRKLNLLDAVDEQSASGKLDLIVQLPYTIKSEARRQQAEARRTDVEVQLKGSKYGIAYIDGTEKVTQLNRPAENNLMAQVEYLTGMLYTQLGLTEEVMNGTADEKTMLNYWNRTIEPILTVISEAMRRTFLTKTARTQNQTILFFKDPFKLVPVSDLADIADKFTRNEIMTSNEFRSVVGLPPSTDPKADQLVNSNMPQPDASTTVGQPAPDPSGTMADSFDQIDSAINEALSSLGADPGAP
jgi:hypothetical protein